MTDFSVPRRNRFHLRLYPEEILGVFFFCLLLVLAWKYGTPINGPTVVVRSVTNAFLIIFGLALISGRLDLSLRKIVRNWVPIVIALMAYENLGNLVRFINPHDADPVLKRIDEYLFSGFNERIPRSSASG